MLLEDSEINNITILECLYCIFVLSALERTDLSVALLISLSINECFTSIKKLNKLTFLQQYQKLINKNLCSELQVSAKNFHSSISLLKIINLPSDAMSLNLSAILLLILVLSFDLLKCIFRHKVELVKMQMKSENSLCEYTPMMTRLFHIRALGRPSQPPPSSSVPACDCELNLGYNKVLYVSEPQGFWEQGETDSGKLNSEKGWNKIVYKLVVLFIVSWQTSRQAAACVISSLVQQPEKEGGGSTRFAKKKSLPCGKQIIHSYGGPTH